jgi:hypothetical protein
MDKVNNKEKTRLLVPLFAMISVVFFLLTGCHQGNRKESPLSPSQMRQEEQVEAKPDSFKEDSMKAFYERMRRWDALHGGMRQRESDK